MTIVMLGKLSGLSFNVHESPIDLRFNAASNKIIDRATPASKKNQNSVSVNRTKKPIVPNDNEPIIAAVRFAIGINSASVVPSSVEMGTIS